MMSDRPIRQCRVCGCTEADCQDCVERLGEPCEWVDGSKGTLCTACQPLLDKPVDVIPSIVLSDVGRLNRAGLRTVGALLAWNPQRRRPAGISLAIMAVIQSFALRWLNKMTSVGPMGATKEQQEACQV
jgi:hypothetical protein